MDPQLVGANCANMSLESQSKVQDFYRGSTILIAGGTGFVGKPLLEKILRSLAVKKVYLLIRSKQGASAEDRFERLLEDRLFDLVRDQVGKVEPVEVDYNRSGFGLQDGIAERLQEEVEVVFYCLADVKFYQPLKEAFRTNVGIGRDVYSWCRSFANLKAVVHTSTFYSDCNRYFVEEKVSDELPFGNYELCMKIGDDLSRDECEKIKESVLGDYPNTYAFTKKIAEVMIDKEFVRDLPIGIYRPPVVSPTYSEPMAGWTDNFYGISAMIRSSVDGVKQVFLGDLNQAGDYAPVDCCVNAMLVCGYDVSLQSSDNHRNNADATVYNHVGKTNKCTHGDIVRYSADCRPRYWERWVWKYMTISTTNEWIYYCLLQLSFWYAGCKDLMTTWLNGANGTDHNYYRRSLQRYALYNQAVAFALKRSWSAYNTNLIRLKRHLNAEDEQVFYFDLDDLDWPQYFKGCVDGVSQLLQQRLKTTKIKL